MIFQSRGSRPSVRLTLLHAIRRVDWAKVACSLSLQRREIMHMQYEAYFRRRVANLRLLTVDATARLMAA
jgi:hypothetical protein